MLERCVHRRRVLLTVSGTIPADLDAQVAAGRRPRADYRAIARALDADVVDTERALHETGRLGALLHRLGGAGLLLAWYCFRHRRRYDVLFTDGEQVGIPLAALTRVFGRSGRAHVMIVHILSVRKKAALMRALRLTGQIDRYVVYCTSQAQFARDELGVPAGRVVLSTFMVDTGFFAPDRVDVERRRMICSAGLERRDYPTLMDAVDGLDVDVVIAAASPWSKQADSSAGRTLPSNVEVRRLSLYELRELYAQAAFVVMPLGRRRLPGGHHDDPRGDGHGTSGDLHADARPDRHDRRRRDRPLRATRRRRCAPLRDRAAARRPGRSGTTRGRARADGPSSTPTSRSTPACSLAWSTTSACGDVSWGERQPGHLAGVRRARSK